MPSSKDLLRVILGVSLMLTAGIRPAVQEIALSPIISSGSQYAQRVRVLFFVDFPSGLAVKADLAPLRPRQGSGRVCWPLHWVLLQGQTSPGCCDARRASVSDCHELYQDEDVCLSWNRRLDIPLSVHDFYFCSSSSMRVFPEHRYRLAEGMVAINPVFWDGWGFNKSLTNLC